MGSFNDIFNGRLREWSLGPPVHIVMASNTLTIPAGTRSYIAVHGEAEAADQLDTITKADAKAGDLLLLTNAIAGDLTVDDANINLGAATRALSETGGSHLLLIYDSVQSEWTELLFINADNV